MKLRFIADPHCRYGEDDRGRARRLRAAVKVLRRSFGIVQYKRGPENPAEVYVCEACLEVLNPSGPGLFDGDRE